MSIRRRSITADLIEGALYRHDEGDYIYLDHTGEVILGGVTNGGTAFFDSYHEGDLEGTSDNLSMVGLVIGAMSEDAMALIMVEDRAALQREASI